MELNEKIEEGKKREKIKNTKRYMLIIGSLAALIVIIFILQKTNLLPNKGTKKPAVQNDPAAQNEQRIPVSGYKASRINFEDTLSVLGTVEGGVQVELHFEKEGRISKVNYKEGDFVSKGAAIAQLDVSEVSLKLEQAEIEYDQHKKLFEAGVIIAAKLKQAEVGLAQARAEYEKYILRAPFDGVLASISQKVGEVVNPTKKIITFFDTKQMMINIGITENDINKLTIDQTAEVVFDAIAKTTYEGHVVNIDPSVDPTTRMMTLKVKVENKETLILPGMFARVKIDIYKEPNALVVPNTALNKVEDKYNAFVIGEGNTVKQRPVEVGYLSSDYASITTGLNDGEIVVIDKLEKMKDGVTVEVLNVEEYSTHTPGKSGSGN